MNWITTNIRLPEEVYMDLKMKAVTERKSVAALIREKIQAKPVKTNDNKQQMLKDVRFFAKKMAKKHKGLNLTKNLIEMRYEQ